MAERSNASVLKTDVPQGTGGSNPSPSAIFFSAFRAMSETDPAKTATSPAEGLARMWSVLDSLRDPEHGCPWDRVQTLESLRPCLIEESYELADAMTSPDKAEHLEELGDVLLQVLFQAHIREQAGDFTLTDVFNAIADKLVRRHPHVFGDVTVSGASDVFRNWEQIKKHEKRDKDGGLRSALAGVPAALPALLRAQRVHGKAARVGFDLPPASGARAEVATRLAAVDEASASGDKDALRREVGDLLFAVANLCRALDVDGETALRDATDRYSARFRAVERRAQEAGREIRDHAPDELQALWDASGHA